MSFSPEEKAIIQDHYSHPRNQEQLPQGATFLENPSCGDRVGLVLAWDGEDRVERALFDGEGCSLAMASASILTTLVKGKDRRELEEMVEAVLGAYQGEGTLEPYGELKVFAPLVNQPVRKRCATLPWETLKLLFES